VPAAPQDAPRHGGDLAFARARYGEPDGGWLDLSTGVNPSPYPVSHSVAGDLARLPDRDAAADLITVARKAYGAPADTAMIATPGSDLAARLIPVVAPAGSVAVVAPTYPGHAEAWRRAGRAVTAVPSVDAIPVDAAIVVVVNPNNPDGRRHEPSVLAPVARRLGKRRGLLIVDEAFADPTPEISLMPLLAGLPALVLRSFGKFYGLPGLRLGFVAGSPAMVERLASLLGDWPVSTAAIALGRAALADDAWRDATRRRLGACASRLRSLLAGYGLAPIGGTDLFVLVQADAAAALHQALARHGVWTRAFVEEPEWLRFGLPADEAGFARLDRALAEVTASAADR